MRPKSDLFRLAWPQVSVGTFGNDAQWVHQGNSHLQITIHSLSKEFHTLFPPRVVEKSHDPARESYDRNADSLPSKLPSIHCPKGSKQRFWCHPCLFKYLKSLETGHSTPTTHPNFFFLNH
jgi:hypothetical protein